MQEIGKNTTIISEYTLVALLQSVVKATKEGYELDLDGIDNFPRQVGPAFILGMVKNVATTEVKQGDTETTEVENAVEAVVESLQGDVEENQGVSKQRGRPARKS
jgi:hypothetical protein